MVRSGNPSRFHRFSPPGAIPRMVLAFQTTTWAVAADGPDVTGRAARLGPCVAHVSAELRAEFAGGLGQNAGVALHSLPFPSVHRGTGLAPRGDRKGTHRE